MLVILFGQNNHVTESEMTDDDSTTDMSERIEDDSIQMTMSDEEEQTSSLKRKRSPEHDNASHINTPQHSDNPGANHPAEKLSDPALCMFFWDLDSDLIGSPAAFLQSLKPETSKYHGNDPEFIQVAQSVVEHLTLETDSLSEIARSLESPYFQSKSEINAVKDPIQTVIRQIFPKSEQWNLHQFVTSEREPRESPEGIVRDILPSRPTHKESVLMPKTPNSPSHFHVSFPLSNPFARIRRNQKAIDIAGSALQFWEELGLEPAHGPKDILALYVYPVIYSVRERLCAFATMLGSSYQNCKLGTHASISDLAGYPNGLVPALITNGSIAEKAAQLNVVCEKLGIAPSISMVG